MENDLQKWSGDVSAIRLANEPFAMCTEHMGRRSFIKQKMMELHGCFNQSVSCYDSYQYLVYRS